MPGPVLCSCGAVLLQEAGQDTVTPIGGEPIRFRRTTDFVICSECLSVYRAADLLAGRPVEESFVEKLERMVEGEEPPA